MISAIGFTVYFIYDIQKKYEEPPYQENFVTIEGKGFILLVKDLPTNSDSTIQRFAWGEPSLPNTWGNLILSNNLGEEIDFVSYSSKNNWPIAADGKGYSLELRNPLEENLITEHWKASDADGGSPGK